MMWSAAILCLWATGAPPDLAAAQNQLLEGRPGEAALLYRAVIERGEGSADVHYNLGIAEHKAGRPTQAILHFEKALRLEPGAPDAIANLRSLRDESEPSFFFADRIEPWLSPLPRDLATWLFLGAHAVFVLSLAAWVGRKERIGGAAAPLLSGLLFLLTLAAGAAVAAHAWVAADPRAVVMKSVRLETGPDPRFDDGGRVEAGARVRVNKLDKGWAQVQLRDGSTGWLLQEHITRLDPL